MFDLYVGIDYSGARTPTSRIKGLQVYASTADELPQKVTSPAASKGRQWNWTRKEIAEWLIEQFQGGRRCIAGLDHAFSFPATYFARYGVSDWGSFIEDFVRHWPTHEDNTYVEFLRDGNPRSGVSTEFRLTDRWTSSAKSVFKFDVQGSVAKSTHAGIPWLKYIRDKIGDSLHFWPFDGWDVPEGKSVIAEVYPAIFKSRCPREGRTADEQDAYAVARWLIETDRHGFLDRYFHPPLTEKERPLAEREGWILGVT